MFPIKRFIVFLLISTLCGDSKAQNVTKIFSSEGDISVAVILNYCQNSELSYSERTLVSSAIWTVERINYLQIILPLKLGISVYKSCSETEMMKTMFQIYENNCDSSKYGVGVVIEEPLCDKVMKFGEILSLRTKTMMNLNNYLVKAVVKFLKYVDWRDNVTLVTVDENIIEMFYLNSKKNGICIKECYVFDDPRLLTLNATGEDPLVFFGTASDINLFVTGDPKMDSKVLFVPLDGDIPKNLSENSFVIIPPHTLEEQFQRNVNILPTPLLFRVAEPLMELAVDLTNFILENCNNTLYKINCLKQKPLNYAHSFSFFALSDLLAELKIDPLQEHFVFDIFQVDYATNLTKNNLFFKPFSKMFSYNMFYDNLTFINDDVFAHKSISNNSIATDSLCSNELIIKRNFKIIYQKMLLNFKTEAWIYAFLSLSLLGVIFCIAILTFLLFAIYQKRTLEGNPTLTLLLLLAVMLLFCSVLPFSIETNKRINKALCITKSLSVTMSYAALFSLLLSRSIVLSSAAREVGFMSHIAGPVQSFLCLFIFGVQASLSLHVINKCNNIFHRGHELLYLMSYNTALLILLLCVAPLIYKSQRNYKEGKYFTVAIILIAIVWSVWLPGFTVLCDEWKEMMVCLGLVATGAVCLGTIFIPRTYLMTIAAERDKLAGALPSIAVSNVMDIYRAHPQPIYDCVNIAAINAATVARAGVTPTAPSTALQQPDLYSCPALPEDLNFELCCDEPIDNDKVTRF